MKMNAFSNPVGCILSFINAQNESDVSKRKELFLDWFKNQSPTFESDQLETIYKELEPRLNFELDFLKELFTKLGWLPHIVIEILERNSQLIIMNGLVRYGSSKVELTEIGTELFNSGTYNEYINSMTVKADFWKKNNVKITDNNEIGSGAFIDKNIIITCKHVYESLEEGRILIEDEENAIYTIKEILRHPDEKVDLLKIVTNEEFNYHPYITSDDVRLIDKVIIFGYPPVPLTSEPFLVANLGEVSSEVDSYLDETDFLILSSITRPGNSGGPVINSYGKLIGIMTQNRQNKISLEDDDFDFNKGLGYATALKAKYINQF